MVSWIGYWQQYILSYNLVYPSVVKEHPTCERANPSFPHTHTYGSGGQSLLNGAHTECSMDYLLPRKIWLSVATVL